MKVKELRAILRYAPQNADVVIAPSHFSINDAIKHEDLLPVFTGYSPMIFTYNGEGRVVFFIDAYEFASLPSAEDLDVMEEDE